MPTKSWNMRFPEDIKQEASAHASRMQPIPMNVTQYVLTAVVEKNIKERAKLAKQTPNA